MTATDQFTAGVRASFDQHAAAARWVAELYPDNAWLREDNVISDLVLKALAGGLDNACPFTDSDHEVAYPFTDRGPEDAHVLLLASGRMVVVGPGTDVEAATRAAADRVARCDYCGGDVAPVASLLPVPAPPQLVALSLCTFCTSRMADAYPDARLFFLEEK